MVRPQPAQHPVNNEKCTNDRELVVTDRTLIELLEYVLRNGALAGARVPFPSFFGCGAELRARVGRPLDEPDDKVSSESVPSKESVIAGTGGICSAGANMPFFVVEADRDPDEKSPFAFGADATLRMNLVADVPIPLGDNGVVGCRTVDGDEGLRSENCAGGKVLDFCGDRGSVKGSLSDFVRFRDLLILGVAKETASFEWW
jgi:hypothetical protein